MDYDLSKIEKVPIWNVHPNDYNPKKSNSKEYYNVVKSIKLNGFKQPILVREVDGEMEIVDGEQRYNACIDLGYEEIYVYNLGEVDDKTAQAMTIWFEVQVPFNKLELAPLVVELDALDVSLPYSDQEIKKFKELDEPPEMVNFKVKLPTEQYKAIRQQIDNVMDEENVSEGRALELLVADGIAGL